MSIKATHPHYAATIEDQQLMRAAYSGERVIKEADITYLPPTPGMMIDGMLIGQDGRMAYDSYKMRALFPDFVSDAVEALLGLMHQNDPTIELPAAMEPLRMRATADGEGLHNLLRRINEQQLVAGRVGALLDLPANPDPAHPLPFISLYYAEALRNWDNGMDGVDENKLTLVVLDESGFKREGFDWVAEERYRVLALGGTADPALPVGYSTYLFKASDGYSATSMVNPTLRGTKLDHIPFVFINSKDILATPDNPPLLGLARIALAVYRGEADYRQTLFMQGQDTLVVVGGIKAGEGEQTRVGAGAKLEVDIGGDAKYIGVSSTGLPELRMSLENDRKAAIAKTGQLIDAMGSKQESGEALKTRLAAQTATLNQIAKSGAAALENLLKSAAVWMGQDPEKVKVMPNLEFADMEIGAKDFVDLMSAKNMGLPLSKESIHAILQERGLTQFDFEEEEDLIETENPLAGTMAGGLAVLPPPGEPAGKDPKEDDNGKE
jgi:hypothetical protein